MRLAIDVYLLFCADLLNEVDHHKPVLVPNTPHLIYFIQSIIQQAGKESGHIDLLIPFDEINHKKWRPKQYPTFSDCTEYKLSTLKSWLSDFPSVTIKCLEDVKFDEKTLCIVRENENHPLKHISNAILLEVVPEGALLEQNPSAFLEKRFFDILCFDIDGTLLCTNTSIATGVLTLNPFIKPIIEWARERHIKILFCTSRTPTSTAIYQTEIQDLRKKIEEYGEKTGNFLREEIQKRQKSIEYLETISAENAIKKFCETYELGDSTQYSFHYTRKAQSGLSKVSYLEREYLHKKIVLVDDDPDEVEASFQTPLDIRVLRVASIHGFFTHPNPETLIPAEFTLD